MIDFEEELKKYEPAIEVEQAEADIKIEYRGEVQIVRILFLDQGVRHAAVHEDQQDGGDDQNLADDAVDLGVEDPGQHDGDNKADQLRAAPLKKAPDQIAEHFASVIHESSQSSYPRRFR